MKSVAFFTLVSELVLFYLPPSPHTHTHFYHELIKLTQYRKVAKVLFSYIGPALPPQ